MLYKIVLLMYGSPNTEHSDLFPVKICPVVRKLHHIMKKFGFVCCLIIPALSIE